MPCRIPSPACPEPAVLNPGPASAPAPPPRRRGPGAAAARHALEPAVAGRHLCLRRARGAAGRLLHFSSRHLFLWRAVVRGGPGAKVGCTYVPLCGRRPQAAALCSLSRPSRHQAALRRSSPASGRSGGACGCRASPRSARRRALGGAGQALAWHPATAATKTGAAPRPPPTCPFHRYPPALTPQEVAHLMVACMQLEPGLRPTAQQVMLALRALPGGGDGGRA